MTLPENNTVLVPFFSLGTDACCEILFCMHWKGGSNTREFISPECLNVQLLAPDCEEGSQFITGIFNYLQLTFLKTS